VNDLAVFLADKATYDHSGGAGMGLVVAAVIFWLLFGSGGKKK
jgi:hypothetical protein